MKVEAVPSVDLAVVLPSLFGFPLDRMGVGGLADGLRQLDSLEAQIAARRAQYIAEAERQEAARREGYGSTTAWLIALSGLPAAVCRSRVAVATALQEMPGTEAAFASGEVSEPRVRLLAQARQLAPEQFRRDEAQLVAQAATVPSRRLPQVLAQWRREMDPDGAEADTERLRAQRALHVSPAWSGLVHLSADLDPEGGGIVLAAIRSLSEPAALDPDDARTPAQCRADALTEICHRHLDGTAGNGSAQRPHLTVTVPWEALREGSGVVDIEAGPISAEAVRRLACDATVSRVILDGDSGPVEVGRAHRVVPAGLRRALDLRDQGCTQPNCQVPARWCDAHHVHHWAEGGTTDLANLKLLCRRHHRAAHHHEPYPRRQ
ncbi:MAG: DUF222 domain-containing protein [Actinomycetota bacterium]